MRILSVAGGGVFGIYPASILDNIDDKNKFNMCVGTSIGATIAATVASKLDINLVDFFHYYMPKIFRGHFWRQYKPWTPKYNDIALNNALQDIFGNMYLGDVKIPLFITTVDLETERLKVFCSTDPEDASVKLWEVCRCSVAAPTYFNPHCMYSDGGLYMNQPSVGGIAAACSELKCKLEEIEICSLGCGENTKHRKLRKWSYLSWGLWILNATLNNASSTMMSYITRSLPIKNFIHIEPIKEYGWKMDSVRDMYTAEYVWENEIKEGIKIVNDF